MNEEVGYQNQSEEQDLRPVDDSQRVGRFESAGHADHHLDGGGDVHSGLEPPPLLRLLQQALPWQPGHLAWQVAHTL